MSDEFNEKSPWWRRYPEFTDIRFYGLLSLSILLCATIAYRRHHGPAHETVIEELIIAKNFAHGEGFKTSVIFPQSLAVLEKETGYEFQPGEKLPDLHHAPLYSIVLGGSIWLTEKIIDPETLWKPPLAQARREQVGFGGDYLALAVNVFFFFTTLLLTFVLAYRLFNSRTAYIAFAGLLLSVGMWDEMLELAGGSLMMTLILLCFLFWTSIDRRRTVHSEEMVGKMWLLHAAGVGLFLGLIFLTEYSAALIGLVFAGYCLICFRGTALIAILGTALAVFILVISPWCMRNIELTGNPLALAAQDISLKSKDPTAEPQDYLYRLSAEGPKFSIPKTINKGLQGIEMNLKERIWSGGGYLFTAFFLIGTLYRFRSDLADAMRWCAVVAVLILLLGQPFTDSGLAVRLPSSYCVPLITIFGAGFFLILLESTKKRMSWEKHLIIGLVLLFHGVSLIHNIAEPKRLRFVYPPYYPEVMARTKLSLMEKTSPEFGIMSDIPAGMAWYSQQIVWAQPREYRDFPAICLYQNMAVLFLSPNITNKPYFSELIRADLDSTVDFKKERYWGAVYAGIQEREIPSFFPLQNIIQLTDNMFVLVNPICFNVKNHP